MRDGFCSFEPIDSGISQLVDGFGAFWFVSVILFDRFGRGFLGFFFAPLNLFSWFGLQRKKDRGLSRGFCLFEAVNAGFLHLMFLRF